MGVGNIIKIMKEVHPESVIMVKVGNFYQEYGRAFFSQYDELVLLNDTFYGPFEPFSKIFETMEKRDVDFWGFTANYDSEDGYGTSESGYIKAHVQMFLIAFRNTVLISDAFDNYWKNYDVEHMLSFHDVVIKHELTFTNYLEENGFCWDTYVDLAYFKSEKKERNYNIYGYSSYNLIQNFNCPFIKRKNLIFDKSDALYINSGMDGRNCLDYIKNNHLYNLDYIFKNLIRLYNPIDLYQGLGLNYIVTEQKKNNKNCLIYMHISDCKTFRLLDRYLSKIEEHDVILVTENKEIHELDAKVKLVDASAYLFKHKEEWMKKYDYVCLLELKRVYPNDIIEIDDSNLIRMIENACATDAYINGISQIFNQNPYIGALYLPESFHNKYFSNLNGHLWKKNLEMIEKNSCYDSIHKFVPNSNQGIWVHSEALSNIENKDLSLEEIIVLLPFTLKKNLKCFGKVYRSNYVANDLVCMERIMQKMLDEDTEEIVYPFDASRILFHESNLRKFIRRAIPKEVRGKVMHIVRHGEKKE